jgi:hypothetical protein
MCLGILEMLRAGTTYVDMYYFEDAIAEVTSQAGMRGVLGESILDIPVPDNKTPVDAFGYTERFIHGWQGDPLITPAVAPHSIPVRRRRFWMPPCSPATITRPFSFISRRRKSRSQRAARGMAPRPSPIPRASAYWDRRGSPPPASGWMPGISLHPFEAARAASTIHRAI